MKKIIICLLALSSISALASGFPSKEELDAYRKDSPILESSFPGFNFNIIKDIPVNKYNDVSNNSYPGNRWIAIGPVGNCFIVANSLDKDWSIAAGQYQVTSIQKNKLQELVMMTNDEKFYFKCGSSFKWNDRNYVMTVADFFWQNSGEIAP